MVATGMLFDGLGEAARSDDVNAAVRELADTGTTERGAIFTRPEVVASILDLSGYVEEASLHRRRLLEPAFGNGDFLLPVIDRLLVAYLREAGSTSRAQIDLHDAIRAVELHRESFEATRAKVHQRLVAGGIDALAADTLCECWLRCDDFLLCALDGEFDVVVGNPPYVRQERIPAALLGEYRRRYRTLFDRADLYVPFYERALDLLSPRGVLGFICANRWLKNRYGGPLREKISRGFHLSHFIDMEGVDAFQSEVIAYPAITVIRRVQRILSAPTRIASGRGVERFDLPALTRAMTADAAQPGAIDELILDDAGDAPWLLDDIPRLTLLRRIEAEFPAIEAAGCKIGIGVATGCDRVFIGDYDALPVEPDRKLPLAMARDLVDGEVRWSGKGVVNPFLADGSLAAFEDFPEFAAYLRSHRDAVAARHVAARNPEGWYRTIDRIHPELRHRAKLLVPDIKGEAVFALDEGRFYPHHNLYFVTAEEWDLRALRSVLRSSLAVMSIATYCTRMAGGFLRFQAQYLRRIRLPRWSGVSPALRDELIAVGASRNQKEVDVPVMRLYGLNVAEIALAQRVARDAQVARKSE